MKLSKVLLAALAVMMIFAIAPLASAGSGESADDPIEIVYVGWSWTYPGWGGDASMGDPESSTAVSNLVVDATNRSKTFDFVVTNQDFEDVYYRQHYIDLDTWNYAANNSVPAYATNAVNALDYDILVVDMFFSPVMDAREPAFYNATVNASNAAGITTVSVNSADYTTNASSAPANFNYRDTSGDAAWHNALAAGNANSMNTSFDDNWLVTLENL